MKSSYIALMALVTCLIGCGAEKPATVSASAQSTEKKVTDGSLMMPGMPQLADLPQAISLEESMLPIEWNMWWGENGKEWAVYVDGVEVKTGELKIETPKAQQGKIEIELAEPGLHEIKVALCNDHGCTESAAVPVEVISG